MRNKAVRAVGLGFLFVGLASAPLLAAVSMADTIKGRIDGFKKLGAASKKVRDELALSSPDIMVLRASARDIGTATRAMSGWFPAGSGPQSGVKTRAKPEIWTKAAEFRRARSAFAAQAAALMKAAASGDIAAVRTENRKLAAGCTTCHRAFRSE